MGSEASVVGRIWSSDESYRNFLHLCDEAGGRFCGTRGEGEARDFIAGRLAEYGLSEVHLESVDHLIWRRGRAELEITEPKRRSVGSLALAYSSPTDPEGIEAELVILPDPTARAFEESGKEIDGKVVLTDIGRGVGPACQSTQWAAALGADALILMANAYGSMQPAGSCRWNQESPIPVVSISKEDGEFLRRLGQKGRVRARCSVECQTEPGRSHNVVGDVPGKGSPGEQVIIGAHYDGFDLAQSAIDNASGTATVMEAARALSARAECPRTIRFVLFAAEELGMVGSLGYATAHALEMKDVSAMVTTDWPGYPASYGVQHPFSDLQDHIRGLADAGTSVSSGLGMYSDHFPFMIKGVPAMWVGGNITGRDLEIYHTAFDTADKVPPRVMKESATLMARAAMDLADPVSWTPGHRTEQEIIGFLEHEGLRPALEAEGRWREGAVHW